MGGSGAPPDFRPVVVMSSTGSPARSSGTLVPPGSAARPTCRAWAASRAKAHAPHREATSACRARCARFEGRKHVRAGGGGGPRQGAPPGHPSRSCGGSAASERHVLLANSPSPSARPGQDAGELDRVEGDDLAVDTLRPRAAGLPGQRKQKVRPCGRAHSATTWATMRPSCSAVSSSGRRVAREMSTPSVVHRVAGVDPVHQVAEWLGAERRTEGDRQRAQESGQPCPAGARRGPRCRRARGGVRRGRRPSVPAPAPRSSPTETPPAHPDAVVRPSRAWWASSRTLAPRLLPLRPGGRPSGCTVHSVQSVGRRRPPSDSSASRAPSRRYSSAAAVIQSLCRMSCSRTDVFVVVAGVLDSGRRPLQQRGGVVAGREGRPALYRLSRGIPNGVQDFLP